MRLASFLLALATGLALGVGISPSPVDAQSSDLEAVQERDDYAGMYHDPKRKVDVYRFTGDARGIEEQLLDHYGDAASFVIETATYSLAELEATEEAIATRLDESREAGLDIRELGIDVAANRVDVGARGGLDAVREALAEHGDRVHVRLSEGATTAPDRAHPETAVQKVDDVKLWLTLDRYPLVAGTPAWATVKITNEGDTLVRYLTNTCDVVTGVRGEMLDARWRPFESTDEAAIAADGRDRHSDLRYRAERWTYVGDETIHIGFAPRGARDPEDWGCADIGVPKRLKPGDSVEHRLRWDSDTIGPFGPPPEGTARLRCSFDFRRVGTPGRQLVEVTLDVPVTSSRDFEWLHPMEAVDAALSSDKFRALVEPIPIGDRTEERILFDSAREVWFVGVCGDSKKWKGNWIAVVVEPRTGEVKRVYQRTTGQYCYEGPW